MFRLFTFLLLSICSFIAMNSWAESQTFGVNCEDLNLVRIPELDKPQGIPQDLERAPWSDAACITGFLDLTGRSVAPNPTHVFLFYDSEALWVAYRCSEPSPEAVIAGVRERDGSVWRDSSVEFFCEPEHIHRTYYQIVVNALGVVYDAKERDASWNSSANISTVTDEKNWSVFMRLPFSDLGRSKPTVGEEWSANFCRSRSIEDRSSWSSLIGSYQEPKRFGHIVFGGRGFKPVQMISAEGLHVGKNVIKMNTPKVRCVLEGRTAKRESVILSSGVSMSTHGLLFDLEYDQVRRVLFRLKNKGQPILMRFSMPIESPCVSDLEAKIEDSVKVIAKQLRNLPEADQSGAKETLSRISARFVSASKIVRHPGKETRKNWESAADSLREIQAQIDDLASYAETLEILPKAGFALGLESSMKKVLIKDAPFEGWFAKEHSLSLARNEHEAFQVVVMPYGKSLKNVTVSVSQPTDLICATVSLVGHVTVEKRVPYDADYHEWYPDPLLDFQNKCDINAGEHVSFWVDFRTEKEAKHGDYEATVKVEADGCEPLSIKVNLHVWKFVLPDLTHLRNAFTFDPHAVRKILGDRFDDKMRQKYYDFLLDHRLNIDHIYRGDLPDLELLKHGVSKGMNAFNLIFTNGKDRVEELAEIVPKLKEAGLLDKAYVYGFDEVKAERFGELRDVFTEIHKHYPGLKTMTTAVDPSFGQSSGLEDAVDIWVPLTSNYDFDAAKKLRANGKEMWWYICINPFHPYANWFTEYPAIESRLLTGFMSYKYQTDGFLYYLINEHRNRKPIDSGPYTNWNAASLEYRPGTLWANGDGSLLCVGENGPLSTIRLENIRDGFEDYEYLYLLNEAKDKISQLLLAAVKRFPEEERNLLAARSLFIRDADALLAVWDPVVQSLTEYTQDPEELYAFRKKVGVLTEKGELISLEMEKDAGQDQ